MTIKPRPYQPEDLPALLRFAGECNRLTQFCGYPHPGDLVHIMSNGLLGENLDEHFFLVEDSSGTLIAVVELYPSEQSGYDLLLHPHQRGGELERDLLAWGEAAMWALMQREGSDSGWVGSDVWDADTVRRDALLAAGYEAEDEPYQFLMTRSLSDALPEPVLPAGFAIRPVEGEHEVEQLCEVHAAAFDSEWTAEEYLRVMRTPGFDPMRELVVTAPDGRFAAFLIYWLDPISKSGLFEPVGAHPDFQRRGLTSALMYDAMRRMKQAGMETALVRYEDDNEAGEHLYHAVGFTVKHSITDFRKTLK